MTTRRPWRARALGLLGATAILGGLLSFTNAVPARADSTAATGDESVSVPAANIFGTGQTVSQITQRLGSTYRLVDLHQETSTTYSFAAVQNSGAYAVPGWWWYYNLTAAQVNSNLSTNGARLISAERLANGNFDVIMVSNTGTSAKSWWWYYGASAATIASRLSTNNARLVSLDADPTSGQYTAVMVANTGVDAKSWWWYYNLTGTQVSSYLTQNGARLVDLDVSPSGTYDVVMVKQTGADNKYWKWLYNVSSTTILNTANQTGYRVFDFQKNAAGTFNAVLIDNLAAEPRRVENIFESGYSQAGLSGATYGYYVKPVGGSAVLALQNATRYEPASGIKALYALYAERQIQLGNDALANSFNYWYDPSNPSNTGPCPLNYSNTNSNKVTTTLKDGLDRMMFNSDNRTTQGVDLRYGRANVNAYAQSIGMTGTVINQTVGCAFLNGGYVYLTLNDITKLYEGVLNNTLINSTRAASFFNRMNPNSTGSITGNTAFVQMVNQEAAALGKSAIASQFVNAVKTHDKGGSYDTCFASGPCSPPFQYIRSDAGFLTLPFKTTTGVLAPKTFVYGDWVNTLKVPCAFTPTGGPRCSATVQADNTTAKFLPEIFRAQVRAALANW